MPWKANYFDNDFSYKGKPNAPYFPGEELKNMPLEFLGIDGANLTYGGEFRHRYMDENHRLPRPAASPRGTYDLLRWRQYLDFKVGQGLRAYIEMLDAAMFSNELPATGIDVNRWNIQNAFVDVQIAVRDDKPVYFRAGRQELLYGTPSAVSPGQQVLSPLDWANTRRNVEGFKLISKGNAWDFDLFAVRPVNTANPTGPAGARFGSAAVASFDDAHDIADPQRWYSGVYSVYRGIQNQTIEPYYVWLQTDNGHDSPTWADGDRHTTGLRWTATKPVDDACGQAWVVLASDVEGAYQFGTDNGLRVNAGFFTSKLGATFSQVAWTPNLSFIYHWGSGDRNATDGQNNTYDILIPLNHVYWGIIDNLAGQNLNQIGMQATVKPTSKLTGVAALHWFELVTSNDKIYTVTGAPATVGSGSGKDVGQELDLIATYAFAANFDVQAGYSWFWYGGAITDRQDAQQFYLQTSIRY